jgi:two-component system, OmpR family, phosphate regulon response regulator PhoB
MGCHALCDVYKDFVIHLFNLCAKVLSMTTNILIASFDEAISGHVSYSLRNEGYQMQIAETLPRLQELVSQTQFQLLILDSQLDGYESADLLKAWRDEPLMQNLPVMLLTNRNKQHMPYTSWDTGAEAYLAKPVAPRDLVGTVRAILRRTVPTLTRNALDYGDMVLDPVNKKLYCNQVAVKLTPTEFKIMHCLMSEPRKIYSRADLLDVVWGKDLFLEERTVDVNMRRLRVVLERHKVEARIDTVRNRGYRFMP